jgi:hypothetical protein
LSKNYTLASSELRVFGAGIPRSTLFTHHEQIYHAKPLEDAFAPLAQGQLDQTLELLLFVTKQLDSVDFCSRSSLMPVDSTDEVWLCVPSKKLPEYPLEISHPGALPALLQLIPPAYDMASGWLTFGS